MMDVTLQNLQPVQNGTVKFAVAAFSLVIQGLSLYLDRLKFEKQH